MWSIEQHKGMQKHMQLTYSLHVYIYANMHISARACFLNRHVPLREEDTGRGEID